MKFYERLGVSSDFDSTNSLVTSSILQPLTLAIVRLTFGFYSLVSIVIGLAWQSAVLGTGSRYVKYRSCHSLLLTRVSCSYLSYFTDLSYIGLSAYFWASGVQTFAYALNCRTNNGSDSGRYPLQRWPQSLQFLHVLLLSSVVSFRTCVSSSYNAAAFLIHIAILITIVYWAVLSSSGTFDNSFDCKIFFANLNWDILFLLFKSLVQCHVPHV